MRIAEDPEAVNRRVGQPLGMETTPIRSWGLVSRGRFRVAARRGPKIRSGVEEGKGIPRDSVQERIAYHRAKPMDGWG